MNKELVRAWRKRRELRAESDKLIAKGSELWAEGNKLRAKADKLMAKADKLIAKGGKRWAESDKLRAEGNLLFVKAVVNVHGVIGLEWKNFDSEKDDFECHLATGEVFKP